MSTLSDAIFKFKAHKVSSPYGPRAVIKTSAGATSDFHNGVDYSTHGLKLAQYAIADGEIISAGVDKAYGNAKFVWIAYPKYGVKMLHYHLDSYAVTAGRKVKKGALLGYTGKTGKATGIHLHLGIKKISGGDYFDAEKWSAEVLDKKGDNYTVGTYKASMDINVRSGPGLDWRKKKYNELTDNARSQMKPRKIDGYAKGTLFTVKEIDFADGYHWGLTASGWVALENCERVPK